MSRWTRQGATVAVLVYLTGAAVATEPLPALERFPALADTFPFGFWYTQAPMDAQLAGAFQETYQERRGKLFHHLARHYTNALITAHPAANTESLDVAGQYGIKLISSAEFLHGHINHAWASDWEFRHAAGTSAGGGAC